jgi:hypothetical protein
MLNLKYLKHLLFFVFSSFLFSQTESLGSWNILNVKYTANKDWSFFAEAQLRSLYFYNNFHYYEYKGGVNYKFNNYLKFSLGLGSYQTYQEGGNFIEPKNNDEFRIFPTIMFFQKIGSINIEQRYRIELRVTPDNYKNRFRYRVGLSYPFGKEIKDYKPYQISVSNELFFSNLEPYFERNRSLIAFNYKTSSATTLQLGYLHQFDYKIFDEIGRDFLVVGLYYEFKNKNHKINFENEFKDD